MALKPITDTTPFAFLLELVMEILHAKYYSLHTSTRTCADSDDVILQIITNKTINRKWEDDSQVANCMSCNKGFTVTVRRVSTASVVTVRHVSTALLLPSGA